MTTEVHEVNGDGHNTPPTPCQCKYLATADAVSRAMATLTAREREVLVLIGKGLPNRLIARRLLISERTVKAHVKNILEKLALQTRVQAAVAAVLHHGLICLETVAGDDSGPVRKRPATVKHD